MRISDWSSDVCSSDLLEALIVLEEFAKISSAVAFPIFESSVGPVRAIEHFGSDALKRRVVPAVCRGEMVVAVSMSEPDAGRSEEHTSELQSLMRISYAVFCLKQKKNKQRNTHINRSN